MIYTEDEVKKKKEKYESAQNSGLPVFSSVYDGDRLAALEKIANGEDFSYDPMSDPVYKSYKQSYIDDGERAMRDTMANAAALSGGNLNSYAVTAGNESFNNYLRKSEEIIPELYNLALKAYNEKLEKNKAVFDLYSDLYDDEYERYSDDVENYYKALSAARAAYTEAYDTLAGDRSYELQLAKAKANGEIEEEETDGKKETYYDIVKRLQSEMMSRVDFEWSPLKIIYKDYAQYYTYVVNQWYKDKKINKKIKDYMLFEVKHL